MTSGLERTAELLLLARSALRSAVMPAVQGELRYVTAMAANAMAIAAREVARGAEKAEAERRELSSFYNGAHESVAALRRRLCRDLRSGALTTERESDLRSLLVSLVRERLAISNPEYRSRSSVTPNRN
jgi:Domain of unknown function (DUF6285)